MTRLQRNFFGHWVAFVLGLVGLLAPGVSAMASDSEVTAERECSWELVPARDFSLRDAVEALGVGGDCVLLDVVRDGRRLRTSWRASESGSLSGSLSLFPAACDGSADLRTYTFAATADSDFRRLCPGTWDVLRNSVAVSPDRTQPLASLLLKASPPDAGATSLPVVARARSWHKTEVFPWWLLATVLGVALAVWCVLRFRGGRCPALTSVMAAALVVAGLARLFFVLVPAMGDSACLLLDDIAWLGKGGVLLTHWFWNIFTFWGDRYSVIVGAGLLGSVVGLQPDVLVWAMLGYHLVNSLLVWFVGRAIGLSVSWALLAALIHAVSPQLVESLFARYLQEHGLATAYLLVALAYIWRNRAATRRGRLVWATVEGVAVFLGVGFKESFLVYYGLILLLDILLFEARSEGLVQRVRGLVRRAKLHIYLMPLVSMACIVRVLDSAGRHNMVSFPGGVVHALVLDLAETVVPFSRSVALSFLPFGWSFAFACLMTVAFVAIVIASRRWRVSVMLLLWSLLALLPGAMITARMQPGYLAVSWPWLALAAVFGLSGCRVAAVRWLHVAWLAAFVATAPQRMDFAVCPVDGLALAEIRQLDRDACASPPGGVGTRQAGFPRVDLELSEAALSGALGRWRLLAPVRDGIPSRECFVGEGSDVPSDAVSALRCLRRLSEKKGNFNIHPYFEFRSAVRVHCGSGHYRVDLRPRGDRP